MSIKVGDRLPDATFYYRDEDGPNSVEWSDKLAGRKVVIFSLPGPFTPTCTAAHMPTFVRTAGDFREKGVDEIICLAVADVHVMYEWGKVTGAHAAGITMLSDVDGQYTAAIDMAFDAPPVGFFGRAKRHAMIVEDGVVKVLQIEESRTTCDLTAGETLLDLV